MQPYIEIQNQGHKWALSEKLTGDGRKVIKIPIAKLGKWDHDVYGEVELTQTDFDQAISNWREARAGYDPPLFLGHPKNTNAMEGDPSEGWPEEVYQEGTVLYGDYVPTDPSLFSDIESQRYRHASAEIIRNAKDKATGEEIGTLLVGVALTNRPFLPLKDHTVEVVEKFSQGSENDSTTLFVFDLNPDQSDLSTTETPMETNNAPTPPVEEKVEAKQEFSEVSTSAPVSASPEVETVTKAEYDRLAEQFSKLANDYSELKEMFSDMHSREKSREVAQKLSKLEQLNLPASTKETFSDMIKSGTLNAEAEEKLFSSYQQLSETYGKAYLESQGEAEKQAAASAPQTVEMPQLYADIIERNKKIAEARRAELGMQQFV